MLPVLRSLLPVLAIYTIVTPGLQTVPLEPVPLERAARLDGVARPAVLLFVGAIGSWGPATQIRRGSLRATRLVVPHSMPDVGHSEQRLLLLAENPQVWLNDCEQ